MLQYKRVCIIFHQCGYPALTATSYKTDGEEMNDLIRVVVADDQNISRGFFELFVRAAKGYQLIAGLRTAQDAVKFADEHDFDLLIMDVMMQDGIDGITAAAQIKSKHPGIRIILTTSAAETAWEDKARAAGVDSFWYKEYENQSLIDMMDRTMAGESVYPDDPPEVNFGKATRDDLTERELDVLRGLTELMTNEEIAERLHISVNTVKSHIRSIMRKTGYESRLELAMNARALGLVVSEKERKKDN